MNYEFSKHYNDAPQKRYNLEAAYRCESKTRQFPFVVASEVDPNDKLKSEIDKDDEYEGCYEGKSPVREFLVFHDIEHYVNLRLNYPHCHEIIRCPKDTRPKPVDYEHEVSTAEEIYSQSNRSAANNSNSKDDEETGGTEDLAKGRLIFDFDLLEPLKCLSLDEKIRKRFVPVNFKLVIQNIIIYVFNTYYLHVDTSKFLFVWQVSRYEEKFSMHLIVKNAYFSEYWVKQSRIFYELMKQTAVKFTSKECNAEEYMSALDDQIPRKNATFRIIGCSKLNGLPLELDLEYPEGIDDEGFEVDDPLLGADFYDCLVGVYHIDQLQQEQCITMSNINYEAIEELMQGNQEESNETTESTVQVPKTLKKSPEKSNSSGARTYRSVLMNETLLKEKKKSTELKRLREVMNRHLAIGQPLEKVNVSSIDISHAVELFEAWNDGVFSIRDQTGNLINLNRNRAAPCRLSGHVHTSENSYLNMRADGRLTFHCRRGCQLKGSYGIEIGMYKIIKRPEGIMPISTGKLAVAANAKTYMIGLDGEICDPKQNINTNNGVNPNQTPGGPTIPYISGPNQYTGEDNKEFDPNGRKKLTKSTKRVQTGIVSTVQIPNFLRVK